MWAPPIFQARKCPRCLIPCVQSAQEPTILNKTSYSLFSSLPWLRGGEGQRRMKKRGFWEKQRVKGAQEPGTIRYCAGSLDRSRLPTDLPSPSPPHGWVSPPHIPEAGWRHQHPTGWGLKQRGMGQSRQGEWWGSGSNLRVPATGMWPSLSSFWSLSFPTGKMGG